MLYNMNIYLDPDELCQCVIRHLNMLNTYKCDLVKHENFEIYLIVRNCIHTVDNISKSEYLVLQEINYSVV